MKRSGPLKRKTGLKPAGLLRGRKKRRTKLEALEQEAWRMHVLGCTTPLWTVTARELPHDLEAHHVIPRQVCRSKGIPEWDLRNGVAVSGRRHDRHHSRHEPITWAELERCCPGVFVFAEEHGMTWWLERHYPKICLDCGQPVSSHEMFDPPRCPVVVVQLPRATWPFMLDGETRF